MYRFSFIPAIRRVTLLIEYPEVPPYPQGHYPGLRAKHEGRLNCRLVKSAGDTELCPFPPQNPGKTRPYTPRLPNIRNHCRPVVMRCGKYPPKIIKIRHRLQRYPIGLEEHRCAFLRLFLYHTIDFPLRSFGTHHHGLMFPVQLFPGNKHIRFGSAREGVVPLLQDH